MRDGGLPLVLRHLLGIQQVWEKEWGSQKSWAGFWSNQKGRWLCQDRPDKWQSIWSAPLWKLRRLVDINRYYGCQWFGGWLYCRTRAAARRAGKKETAEAQGEVHQQEEWALQIRGAGVARVWLGLTSCTNWFERTELAPRSLPWQKSLWHFIAKYCGDVSGGDGG